MEHSSKPSEKKLIILLVIIIIVYALGMYFLFQKFRPKKTSTVSTATSRRLSSEYARLQQEMNTPKKVLTQLPPVLPECTLLPELFSLSSITRRTTLADDEVEYLYEGTVKTVSVLTEKRQGVACHYTALTLEGNIKNRTTKSVLKLPTGLTVFASEK